MYDPNELDAKIAKSHINAEKVEEEAKALENKVYKNLTLIAKSFWNRISISQK